MSNVCYSPDRDSFNPANLVIIFENIFFGYFCMWKSIIFHHMNKKLRFLIYLFLYAIIWLVIFFEGRFMLFVQEQMQLFQNEWHYIMDHLLEVGGVARVLTEALVQFYHVPWIGVTLLTSLAVFSIFAFEKCLRRFSDAGIWLVPFSSAPVILLLYCVVVCQDTFPIAAFALTAAISAIVLNSDRRYSWILSSLISPILYLLCGSTAMLLPLMSVASGVSEYDGRKNLIKSLIPAVVYALYGLCSVRTNLTGEAIGFYAYPYPMYESVAGNDLNLYVMSSWLVSVLVVAIVVLIDRRFESKVKPVWTSVSGIVSVTLVIGALWLVPEKEYALNVGYDMYSGWAELHYLYENERYDDLLKKYEDKEPHTSVESNYINLALYRTGRLASDFFRYRPKWKHFSLQSSWLDMQFPFPYIWVETSDEMGALSKARQAAYEGNVMAGPDGASPMVKYLAENDIIRGDYVSADKYLSCLENTVYYKEWAAAQRRFLNDEAVLEDQYYSSKRACLYDEKRTLYDMNDLWLMIEVAKNSPEHRSTYDYAGMMVLAAGELNTFVDWMIKMTEAGRVHLPLPPVFQDAMAMAFANNPNALQIYKIEPERVSDYKEYVAAVKGRLTDRVKVNSVMSKNRDRLWTYIDALNRNPKR